MPSRSLLPIRRSSGWQCFGDERAAGGAGGARVLRHDEARADHSQLTIAFPFGRGSAEREVWLAPQRAAARIPATGTPASSLSRIGRTTAA